MANRYSDRPYAVGKGKPPVHTQFGKDRPGNRNGRPRGSRNSDTILEKALAARISVKEAGRERKISKHEAILTQLVNKAAGGDLKAIEQVMRIRRDIEQKATPEVTGKPLSEADRIILELFAERLRGEEESGT